MTSTDFITSLKQELETASKRRTLPPDDLAASLLPVYERYRDLKDKHVLVLFSGGLDTSYMVHFLTHVVGAKVTTFTVDVGSTEPRETSWAAQQEKVAERSSEMGAIRHIAVDGRDDLSTLGMEAVQAEAGLDGGRGHPPASSLSRVVICKKAIDAAIENNCNVVMHGSNGLQNNPYRYFNALSQFATQNGKTLLNSAGAAEVGADIKMLRELDLNESGLHGAAKGMLHILQGAAAKADMSNLSKHFIMEATPNLDCPVKREEAASYLERAGHAVRKDSQEGAISTDENLLGNEREEAGISNVSHRHYPISVKPETPVRVSIRFTQGKPVALKVEEGSWQNLDAQHMFERLNELGYARHIGVFDGPEARPVGTREREIHISPAMAILRDAHYRLRKNILKPADNHLFTLLSNDWSSLVMEANLYVDPAHGTENNLRSRVSEALAGLSRSLDGDVSLTLDNGRIMQPQIVSTHISPSEHTRPVRAAEVEAYHANPPRVDFWGGVKNPDRIKQQHHPLWQLHEDCARALGRVFALRDVQSADRASVPAR